MNTIKSQQFLCFYKAHLSVVPRFVNFSKTRSDRILLNTHIMTQEQRNGRATERNKKDNPLRKQSNFASSAGVPEFHQ